MAISYEYPRYFDVYGHDIYPNADLNTLQITGHEAYTRREHGYLIGFYLVAVPNFPAGTRVEENIQDVIMPGISTQFCWFLRLKFEEGCESTVRMSPQGNFIFITETRMDFPHPRNSVK